MAIMHIMHIMRIMHSKGKKGKRTHQGSAMDVLARIESVNMCWYILVCILACIFVRIGMYEPGTY